MRKTHLTTLTLSLLLATACQTQPLATKFTPPMAVDKLAPSVPVKPVEADFRILAQNGGQTTKGWFRPIATYPNRNGYLGWKGSNSYFDGKHTAVDLGTPVGTPVYAIADGVIAYSRGDVGSYGGEGIPGGGLVIQHQTASGQTFHAVYAHLQNRTGKRAGERVSAGEKIAEVGHYYAQNRTVDWPHLHFGIFTASTSNPWQGYASEAVMQSAGWTDPVGFLESQSPTFSQVQQPAGINRAQAIADLLKALNIPANMSAFNTTLFGQRITSPTDVNKNTPHHNAIVTAYNRGILNSSTFRPTETLNRAELVTLLSRALPLLEYPEFYRSLPYTDLGNEWYRSAVERTYSAGVLPSAWMSNKRFDAAQGVSQSELTDALSKAAEYQRGGQSGINIYLDWTQSYADLDLYILDESVPLKYDQNFMVTNFAEVREHSGTVYWQRNSSSWGGALDYDSWAGQGSQPVHPSNGERVSVDPRKIKRPGKYRILVHYYAWSNGQSPASASFSWYGYQSGKNINTTGAPFQDSLAPGQLKFVGQLNAN